MTEAQPRVAAATYESVSGRTRAVLGEVLGNPALAATITDDTDIIHDLGLDSIQAINFLLALEDAFDVELEFEELTYEQLQRFSQVCGFVIAALESS
ncbi:acyl carrier protein [Actinophytocola sp.]|uniref:acyl carrier protein n=1 Tax=Actinophytocola sp. TaxID=1872138 RepID=UPI003899C162